MRFNSNIKGIFKVSSANIVALALSMLTSFVLPIFISVEEYGYWQLFVLYAGYAGFFVFGFNDGVHLNYAACEYNETLASKFRTFTIFLSLLTSIETIGLFVALMLFPSNNQTILYILLLCILNIFPQAIYGLFTYMNQSTLRFTEYAIGNIFDKILFAVFMVALLLFHVQDALIYIIVYTITRYMLIGYFWYSSRLVFTVKAYPIFSLRQEIVNNFRNGFPLMIATILQGTIIVGSRLLVQAKFGIESFGAFSFSIHTIVIAAQFIGAVATVFYPIMKRANSHVLHIMYNSFDKISSLFSTVLLLSYFIVVVLINLVYTKYSVILNYLFWVYPLFIYTCKANILITNFYKVKNQPQKLIVINAFAILLHMIFALFAYYIFDSIYAIACSVLLSYALWYYLCQVYIYIHEHWRLSLSVFYDIASVAIFSVVVILTNNAISNVLFSTIGGFTIFSAICYAVYLMRRQQINDSIKEFSNLLHK